MNFFTKNPNLKYNFFFFFFFFFWGGVMGGGGSVAMVSEFLQRIQIYIYKKMRWGKDGLGNRFFLQRIQI